MESEKKNIKKIISEIFKIKTNNNFKFEFSENKHQNIENYVNLFIGEANEANKKNLIDAIKNISLSMKLEKN